MKKYKLKFLAILPILLFASTHSWADHFELDSLLKQVDEKIIKAKKVIEGGLSLYECTILIDPKSGRNTNGIAIEPEFSQRFFVLVDEELVSLTPGNYKKKIKHLLPRALELHKRLGKRGFRYKNIPQMIQFYNQFHWGNGQLTEKKAFEH